MGLFSVGASIGQTEPSNSTIIALVLRFLQGLSEALRSGGRKLEFKDLFGVLA